MATLGCSTHTAFIQGKCNRARLCELTDASEITYNRKLDDISTATVVIPITGNDDSACCECLGDVEPWCHQLTIVREGDGVVWTGPIQKVNYGRNEVVIEASDKLAWLLYRVNEINLCYGTGDPGCAPAATDLADIAIDIITLTGDHVVNAPRSFRRQPGASGDFYLARSNPASIKIQLCDRIGCF